MTACVNNQNENKGGVSHKVLRSVVAGVMAVSMVPTTALATEAAVDPAAEVAPLAVSPADDFSAGEVTAAVNNAGAAVDLSKSVEWVKDSKDHYIIPTQVTTGQGTIINLEKSATTVEGGIALNEVGNEDNTFVLTFVKDVDGEPSGETVAAPNGIGVYHAVVTATGDCEYANGSVSVKFAVVAKSLKDATLFQVGEDAKDYSDTEFVFDARDIKFDGTKGNIALLLDDVVLKSSDYSVEIFADGASVPTEAVRYAGSYTAVVTGENDYAGSTVKIPFTIEKLNLSEADVVLNSDYLVEGETTAVPSIATVNGSDGLASLFTLTFKSSTNGDSFVQAAGTYTYDVVMNTTEEAVKAKASIEGSTDVTFDVMAKGYATIDGESVDFGNKALLGQDASFAVNYLEGDEAFDLSEIKVTVGEEELASDQYTVTVTDAEGNEGDISKPGDWTVTVTAIPSKCDYKVRGTAIAKVHVTNGEINADTDLFFKFNGKVAASTTEVTYDGTDQLDNFEVLVKTGKEEKVLVEGSDYEIEIVNYEGDVVDTAVNADTYKVTVSSDSWEGFDNETFTLVVNEVKPEAVRMAGVKTIYVNEKVGENDTIVEKKGLPYTGEEIVPTFEYTLDDAKAIKDGTAEWKTIPADAYELYVTQSNKVVTVKETGTYRVNLNASDEEMAKNYDLSAYANKAGENDSAATEVKIDCGTGNDGAFEVINATLFSDVKASDWFSEYVTAAAAAKPLAYFNGYAGGIFLPENNLTRAEAVKVLANMAGVSITELNSKYSMYVAAGDEFEDVTVDDWFVAELGWAKTIGLVQGKSATAFDPNGMITREEFAQMMANFCKTFGEYTAADLDVIADYEDAEGVSDWAEPAVAWAVENGLMGANPTLNATDNVKRAEACKMVVNYMA